MSEERTDFISREGRQDACATEQGRPDAGANEQGRPDAGATEQGRPDAGATRARQPWYRQAFQADYLDLYLHRDLAEAARAVRFLARALGLDGSQRLLDLCCGPGRHLFFLGGYVKQAVGLDLSRVLLERAKDECGMRNAECGMQEFKNPRIQESKNSRSQKTEFISYTKDTKSHEGHTKDHEEEENKIDYDYDYEKDEQEKNSQSTRTDTDPHGLTRTDTDNSQHTTHNSQLVQADMRHLPLGEGAFDRVVNLFTSFGYFEREEDNAAVLAEIARVLRPGGLLALDHINREAMLAHLRPLTERALPDGRLLVEKRRWDSTARRVIKDVTCREPGGQVKGWSESVRVYEPDELEGMMAAAGLEPAARYGDYDGGAWRADAARLIVIARRT